MFEYEKAFVFTWDNAKNFLHLLNFEVRASKNQSSIDDWYLDKNTRIRKIDNKYYVTKKSGDKADNVRQENEQEINEPAALLVIEKSVLHVKKTRHVIPTNIPNITITCDFVESPMKVAIIEIESQSVIEKFPVIFSSLISCPLSAFDYFKRRIGICGPPSCGKSETSKIMSHKLNTIMNANSYHVAEFATTFIQKYDRYPSFDEQFFVWHGQREREINANKANIVISDCPTFLSYVYLMHLKKKEFDFTSALYLSKIYKRVLFDLLEMYTDLVFLKIKTYVDNNIRYQSMDEALIIQNRIQQFLTDHNIKHYSGTYEDADKILEQIFYINTSWSSK